MYVLIVHSFDFIELLFLSQGKRIFSFQDKPGQKKKEDIMSSNAF